MGCDPDVNEWAQLFRYSPSTKCKRGSAAAIDIEISPFLSVVDLISGRWW